MQIISLSDIVFLWRQNHNYKVTSRQTGVVKMLWQELHSFSV